MSVDELKGHKILLSASFPLEINFVPCFFVSDIGTKNLKSPVQQSFHLYSY